MRQLLMVTFSDETSNNIAREITRTLSYYGTQELVEKLSSSEMRKLVQSPEGQGFLLRKFNELADYENSCILKKVKHGNFDLERITEYEFSITLFVQRLRKVLTVSYL